MSVSFFAKSKNISGDFLANVQNFCQKLTEKHQWKGEVMQFFVSEGALLGSFKCNWKNIFSVCDDIAFAVDILTQSSKEFSITWEVHFPEFVGEIINGNADKGILGMVLHFKEMAENQRQKTQRTAWNPAEKGKKPRTTDKQKLQSRWTKQEIIALINSRDFSQIPLTDKNTTDLRGIEFVAKSQLLDFQNIDFSHSLLQCKVKLKYCFLDFVHSEGFVVQQLIDCSLVASQIDYLRQSTISLNEFSFTDNDFSHCKIGEISGNIGLTSLPFVENSIFDFGKIASIKSAYFKNCSFKNTNFNKAEISNSLFENCDFTGASFDSVHYSKNRFVNCTGLNQEQMIQYFQIFYGTTLSQPEDILMN